MERISLALSATTLLVLTALPVHAAGIIRCTADGKADVIITLKATKKLNRIVSCIEGDFIADMTPCAPSGSYGLSYPTGSASLREIVARWQEFSNHLGGIVFHRESSTQVFFDGGFFNGSERGSTWSDQWNFTIDRLSGKGTLKLDDKVAAVYKCARAVPKL